MVTSNNYNYSNVVIFIVNLQNPANITRQNMQCRNEHVPPTLDKIYKGHFSTYQELRIRRYVREDEL